MSVTASLISLMCVRTALTAGIPGFKDFAGGNQAAELLNKLLHHTAGTLGSPELPKDNPLEKAGRECLSAAALLARQAMLWEMGDRTPVLQLVLQGWRQGTLFTTPLAEARQLPGETWLKGYTKLVRHPDHWKDFRVQWTVPPVSGGPAADGPLALFDPLADPQTADDLHRALRQWIHENNQDHHLPPDSWETGLTEGFISDREGVKRIRFHQAWCVLLRDKLRTTPALATDFFAHALLTLTPQPAAPPSPAQQQEFIHHCTQALQTQLAHQAGPLLQKADEILSQLDRIEEAVQTADQSSQQRDHLTHDKLEEILAELRKPRPAIEAANEARAQAGPGASPEEVQAQAAASLGLSATAFQAELQKEGTDTDDVLRQIEATKQRLAPALAALDDAHRLALTRKADAEYTLGHWRAAEPLYRQALALTNREIDWDAWSTQAWKLSLLFQDMRVDTEAECLLQSLLTEHTFHEGKESQRVISLTNNLANLLIDRGDMDGAEPLCRRALEARERILGSDHPETLSSLNNLAILLRGRGDMDGAELLHRRALEARERILGSDHPDTLNSLNNLAILLFHRSDMDGAESLYSRALEARERILGLEHPDTLSSLSCLANLLSDRGDRDEAELLCRRALEARERILGPEHPHTLISLNNLATLLSDRGDRDGAELLYRRALETRERIQGLEHPDTLASLNNLAILLHGRSDRDGAEPLYRRVLEAREHILGPEHPDTLTTLNDLAILLRERGDTDGAGLLFRRALEARERILGTKHPDTLHSYYNLAALLLDKKEYPEALAMMERAVTGRMAKLGPQHPDTLQSVEGVGIIKRCMDES